MKNIPKRERSFRIVRGIAFTVFALFSIVYLRFLSDPSVSNFLYPLEMVLYDIQIKLMPDEKAPPSVAVAAIDDRSLEKYGRWPWNRKVISDFIEKSFQKGAKGIVFDVVFSEQVELELNKKVEELSSAAGIPYKNPNEEFIQILKKYGNKVVMGSIFESSFKYEWEKEKEKISDRDFDMIQSKASLMFKPLENTRELAGTYPMKSEMINLILPEKTTILPASASLAFFNMEQDNDAITRKYPLILGIKKNEKKWLVLPSLALAAIRIYENNSIPKILYSERGIEMIEVGKYSIPVNEEGKAWINNFGDESSFYTFSIADIENADVSNKVIFVGSTAMGTAYDVRATSKSNNIPGVYIHTTFFSNIIRQSFVDSGLPNIFPFLFLLFPLFFLHKIYYRFQLFITIGLTWVYTLILLVISYLFLMSGYLVYSFTPIIFLWIIMLGVSMGKYFFVDRERDQMKAAFEKYLDPKLLKRVTGDVNQIKLFGDKKEIAALFADIVGFTSLSEAVAPEVMIQCINRLFTPATAAVFEHNGFLDKYMGDAMMALYGAPIDIPDKEKEACRTALKIVERMDAVRKEFIKEGKPDVKMGVGVNVGEAIVGNMGSEKRFNYSAIGDAINTASRLEGLTRKYGVRIVASDKIFEKAGDEFLFRLLDIVKVKGKHQGVKIYELMCASNDPHREKSDMLRKEYEDALRFFIENNMNEVTALYKKSRFQDDFAFTFLNERAEEIKITGEIYEGIWSFDSK